MGFSPRENLAQIISIQWLTRKKMRFSKTKQSKTSKNKDRNRKGGGIKHWGKRKFQKKTQKYPKSMKRMKTETLLELAIRRLLGTLMRAVSRGSGFSLPHCPCLFIYLLPYNLSFRWLWLHLRASLYSTFSVFSTECFHVSSECSNLNTLLPPPQISLVLEVHLGYVWTSQFVGQPMDLCLWVKCFFWSNYL